MRSAVLVSRRSIRPDGARIWAWVALAALLCGTSAAVAVSGATSDAGFVAGARALMVGVPMAVGLYAWRRRTGERYGPLLVATGIAWFATTLAESGDAVAYSVGRASGWIVELLLVYLVLSFPTGRLPGRRDRLILAAGAAVVAVLYLPTLLLDADFPVPSPYTSCASGCPPNAFFVSPEPASVDALILPLRALLSALLFAAATVRLTQRLRTASPLMRRVLTPVLGVAIARTAVMAVALVVRAASPGSEAVVVAMWMTAFAVPAIAVGFATGMLRQRLFVADAVQRLFTHPRDVEGGASIRRVLAEAFGDPGLQVARSAGTYAAPRAAGRCVTQLHGDGPVAAIVHDDALRDQGDALAAAAEYVATGLENARLIAQVDRFRQDLRSSHTDALAAAGSERKRIERDLHDGAQQRLIALGIELELLGEVIVADPRSGLERLHALGHEIDAALIEIQSLGRGEVPPLLSARGLVGAVRALAEQATPPASFASHGVGRHSAEVETAVYFAVSEALQNAVKHGRDPRGTSITLFEDGELRFEVRDHGAGFDATASDGRGRGLSNMRDRLAAVGGDARIDSLPGAGTVVSGCVPLPARTQLPAPVGVPAISAAP